MLPWAKAASQAFHVFLSFGRHWGNPSVRRIYDERRLAVRLATLLPIRLRVDRDALFSFCEVLSIGFRLAFGLPLPLCQLLIGQSCSRSETCGALHRDIGVSRPLTLKIRITPWGLRWRPGFALRHCGQRGESRNQHE